MGSIIPAEVHLFDSAASGVLDMDELVRYCEALLPPVSIVKHPDFFSFCADGAGATRVSELKDRIAARLAEARVGQPIRLSGEVKPLPGVVAYERRMLDREPPRPVGALYDGFELSGICAEMLAGSEMRLDGWAIIITDQLFGTLEPPDARYHARVSIYADPCLVSTTGLVEAPAKPRDYYLARGLGLDAGRLYDGVDDFLKRDDPRTTEALKGYLAQAFFYHLTGEPFCEDRSCRLYNAHWQAELLEAQLGGDPEFCGRHERMLASILEENARG